MIPMPDRAMINRRLIAVALLAFFVMACRGGATAIPEVAVDVQPTTDAPISGRTILQQLHPDRLEVVIYVQPADLPPLAAEVRRGDCTSNIALGTLSRDSSDSDRVRFVGQIDGTLATTPPVAIVLLDANTGLVIACGAIPAAP